MSRYIMSPPEGPSIRSSKLVGIGAPEPFGHTGNVNVVIQGCDLRSAHDLFTNAESRTSDVPNFKPPHL